MNTIKVIAIALLATSIAGCKMKAKPIDPPSQPPSINVTIKTNDRGDLIRLFSTSGGSYKAGKVRVCIANSSSGRNKGLHFKRTSKPKYVVRKKNDVSCGHYSPGKKTFFLWRNTPFGKWKLRKIVKLDLSRFAGQQVTFDWVRD